MEDKESANHRADHLTMKAGVDLQQRGGTNGNYHCEAAWQGRDGEEQVARVGSPHLRAPHVVNHTKKLVSDSRNPSSASRYDSEDCEKVSIASDPATEVTTKKRRIAQQSTMDVALDLLARAESEWNWEQHLGV